MEEYLNLNSIEKNSHARMPQSYQRSTENGAFKIFQFKTDDVDKLGKEAGKLFFLAE